jgi:anthranilate phosphoribosyltransferase
VSTADHGLAEVETDELRGGDGEANAALIVAILEGQLTGAAHDVVALNAGAALVVAGRADDLRAGVELAAATIASGAAREQLERLRTSAAEAARTAHATGAAEAAGTDQATGAAQAAGMRDAAGTADAARTAD